jgi:hypothetical protein
MTAPQEGLPEQQHNQPAQLEVSAGTQQTAVAANETVQSSVPYSDETQRQQAESARAAIAEATQDQPAEAPVTETTADKESGPAALLDRQYSALLQQEKREPLPDDPIKVLVQPGSSEHAALVQAGITPERIATGKLTRQELLGAGFSFVNVLGGGEKGVINGVVPDAATGEPIDFTGRVLLTRHEVESVYQHQQSQPETYGLQGQDVHEVRRDMVSFVQEATTPPVFADGQDFAESVAVFNPFLDEQVREPVAGEDADWDVVQTYLKRQVKSYLKEHPDQNSVEAFAAVTEQFAKEHCADIYTWREASENSFQPKVVRGHHVQSDSNRRVKLQGDPSPFLESGFVFSDNLDANVFWGEETDQRSSNQSRINTATIHLAGAHPDFPGFSEMGDNVDPDQQYMQTGRYVSELYPKDEAARKQVQDSERDLFNQGSRVELTREAQQRLIEMARADRTATRVPLWRKLLPKRKR